MNSFVDLVQFLFTIPDMNSFLSNKLCQDSVEKFFGQQRQRGRVNENPKKQSSTQSGTRCVQTSKEVVTVMLIQVSLNYQNPSLNVGELTQVS